MVCFKFLHPKFSNNTNKHKLKKQSAKVGIFQAFSADCMGTNKPAMNACIAQDVTLPSETYGAPCPGGCLDGGAG